MKRTAYLLLVISVFLLMASSLQTSTIVVREQSMHPAVLTDVWHAGAAAKYCDYDASSVQVSIRTPSGIPTARPNDDAYTRFVGISVWDYSGSSENSYDQLGFESPPLNYNNEWRILWSWTEFDQNGDIHYYFTTGDALQLNTLYIFKMSIGYGYVSFRVYKNSVSSGNLVFSEVEDTGGSYFSIDNDFTVYEEIWYEGASTFTPGYDFKFEDTYVNGVRFDSWVKFYSGAVPGCVVIYVSTYFHYVWMKNNASGGGGGGGDPVPY